MTIRVGTKAIVRSGYSKRELLVAREQEVNEGDYVFLSDGFEYVFEYFIDDDLISVRA